MALEKTSNVTRKSFLKASGGAVVAAAVTGCDILTTQPAKGDKSPGGDAERPGKSSAPEAKEAPMLARRVREGDLPVLEKRLPSEPLVVEEVDRDGVYGGEWRTMISGPDDTTWLDRTVGYETPTRWTPDWTGVTPNIFSKVDANMDGTEFVLHLRPGLRWSDGEEFTADDIVFAQNDVVANKKLGGGDDKRAEKLDKHSVRLTLGEPNALFIQHLATNSGHKLVEYPKHYLKKFHPSFNDGVDKLVAKSGMKDWASLFGAKSERWQNTSLPTLNPWVVKNAAQTRIVVERNPYYWKVDSSGRQLPYLDRVVFNMINKAAAMVLKVGNGEIDMHVRHINTPDNKPVLARSRDKGGYHFFDAPSSNMNTMIVAFNLTTEEAVLHELFNEKRFRVALSLAIDREEIIEVVYQHLGKPWQAGPRPESDLHNEKLATQYTKFNPDEANRILDDLGLTERDADGFRRSLDGSELSFPVDVRTDEPTMIEAMNLIKGYWKKVGIKIAVNTVSSSLQFTRELANEHRVSVATGDGGWRDAWLDPRFYLPVNAAESIFAMPWALWYSTNGEKGREPDRTVAGKAARRQFGLYDKILSTTDEERQRELMKQILDMAADTFYVIGTSLPMGGYGIVKDNFHNVPKSMPDSWMYPTPGPTNPEQYFSTR